MKSEALQSTYTYKTQSIKINLWNLRHQNLLILKKKHEASKSGKITSTQVKTILHQTLSSKIIKLTTFTAPFEEHILL